MIIELLIIFFLFNIVFYVFLNTQEGFNLKKAAKKAAKKAKKAAKKAGSGIASAAQTVGSGIESAAQAVGNAVTTAATTGVSALDEKNRRRWDKLRDKEKESKELKKKALDLEKDIIKLEKRYNEAKVVVENDGLTEGEVSDEQKRLRKKHPLFAPMEYNC
tara:strand:- start:466 stop:948 length:483 start_codon:yes stop_codon:yes gene_type:complete